MVPTEFPAPRGPHNLVPDNLSELMNRVRLNLEDEQDGDEPGDDTPQELMRAAEAPPEAQMASGGAKTRLPRRYTVLQAATHQHSLGQYAARYIAEEVYGVQAENTLNAKMRDLGGFIQWFLELNGHGEIGDWLPRDTMAYLLEVEKGGRKPATVNRVFATLRHFSRWVNEQPGAVFTTHGLPTRGIKELVIEEPDCKKLSRVEIHRLFRAADTLCLTEKRMSQKPRRTREVFALIYTTGLRVSELIDLKIHQYDGRYLRNVRRKGRGRTRGLYLVSETRAYLDDYLVHERACDDPQRRFSPLFLTDSKGSPLRRQRIRESLIKLGQEAGKHSGQVITVHPHRLRHTFGAEYRAKTGSDTETASALGHASLKYVGRYVRKTDLEREASLESTFSSSHSS